MSTVKALLAQHNRAIAHMNSQQLGLKSEDFAYQASQSPSVRWGGKENPTLADNLFVTDGCWARQSQFSSGFGPFRDYLCPSRCMFLHM